MYINERFQLYCHIEELNTCLNRRLVVILSWLPFHGCKFLIRPSVEPVRAPFQKTSIWRRAKFVFLPRRRFQIFFFFSFLRFATKIRKNVRKGRRFLSLAFLSRKARWFLVYEGQSAFSWRVMAVVGGLPSSVACETPRVIHGLSTLVTGIRPWSSFPDGSTTVTRARALKDPSARDFAFANTV